MFIRNHLRSSLTHHPEYFMKNLDSVLSVKLIQLSNDEVLHDLLHPLFFPAYNRESYKFLYDPEVTLTSNLVGHVVVQVSDTLTGYLTYLRG